MKFRVSIAGIMAAAALIAVDCGTIRALAGLRHPANHRLILCVVPMANVLLAVLIRLRSAVRRGTARPFPIGFVAAGFAALAVYVASILAFPGAVGHALVDPLGPLWPLAERSTVGIALMVVLGLAWSQTPVLLPAFLGGWLCRRRKTSKRTGSAAVPPRPLGIGGVEPATTRLVDPAASR